MSAAKASRKGAGPGEKPEAAPAKALDALFADLDKSNAPGAVIGIAHGGRLLYRRAFGLSSIEHDVAMTPATRLRIGSTSKHFACLAAFLLAEEGRLDVDGPIGRWIPELDTASRRPTLRQCMQHTGGLRDYLDLAFTAAGLALQPAGTALAAQERQKDVNFAPGEGQLYCNGGYHLLSLAIERAAGMAFEQVLKARIFEPLGLQDTESVPTDMVMTPRIATLHVPAAGGGWRRGIFPSEEVRGEGAMVSTVDDMLAWLAHLRGPWRVGTAETWQQMTTPASLANGFLTTYACGLWRHAYRGLDIVHHSGNVIGGSCQMLTVPAHALDVVIITNGAAVVPTELAKKVIDLLLADHITVPRPPMAISRGYRPLFGQRYHSESGMVLGFDDVGGKLGVSLQLSSPAPVLRDEGETLRVGFEDVGMGPFVLAKRDLRDGRDGTPPATIEVAESGRVERYRRLPGKPPSVARAGSRLVGRYRSADLATEAVIVIERHRMTMHFQGVYGAREHILSPVSSNVFSVTATDEYMPARYALTVPHDADATAVDHFHISTARTRRLRFERVAEPLP